MAIEASKHPHTSNENHFLSCFFPFFVKGEYVPAREAIIVTGPTWNERNVKPV